MGRKLTGTDRKEALLLDRTRLCWPCIVGAAGYKSSRYGLQALDLCIPMIELRLGCQEAQHNEALN